MGIIGHGRAVEEAQYTKEQAIAWAAQGSRWPTRRYIVESQGIRSRLLTETMAGSVRNLRGGVIRELIPRTRELAGLPSRRRGKHADLPVCPSCKAAAATPCKTAAGKRCKTHKPRLATPPTEPERTPSA